MTDRVCPGGHTTEHPAPALRNDEHLCRRCVHHAERVAADLPALLDEVAVTAARQDRGGQRDGGRSANKPLPVALDHGDRTIDERARDTLALLFEWVDYLAEWHRHAGLPVNSRKHPLPTLLRASIAIVLRHADWMRTNEQGPNLYQTIIDTRRRMRRLVDRRPERVYAGRCDADLDYPHGYRCRLPLFREWGDGVIRCDGHTPGRRAAYSGCGATHQAHERREWLRAEVAEQLLPLRLLWEDLHELVDHPPDWDTVRQWTRERRSRTPRRDAKGRPRTDKRGRDLVSIIVTPPRLEPQSWTVDGTPLYRGADVLRLADDSGVRRGRQRVRRGRISA